MRQPIEGLIFASAWFFGLLLASIVIGLGPAEQTNHICQPNGFLTHRKVGLLKVLWLLMVGFGYVWSSVKTDLGQRMGRDYSQ